MITIEFRGSTEAEAIKSFESTPDRIKFEDRRPIVEVSSAIIMNGRLIKPSDYVVKARMLAGSAVIIVSLDGIGDAMWTRGVIRETLNAGLVVYLKTKHKWAFWDFESISGFNFFNEENPVYSSIRIATYLGCDLSKGKTLYEAMSEQCHVPTGNFRLSAKKQWVDDAITVVNGNKRPLLVYRPLLRSNTRQSVMSRNPDRTTYEELYKHVKNKFFTVAVAATGVDEMLYGAVEADMIFCKGQLPITTIIGLFTIADVVFTNPGMALVVAAALGTPVVGIFGGYEDSHNYKDTVVYGKSLLIDPINPCRCMSDSHNCDKRIDVAKAKQELDIFVEGL